MSHGCLTTSMVYVVFSTRPEDLSNKGIKCFIENGFHNYFPVVVAQCQTFVSNDVLDSIGRICTLC